MSKRGGGGEKERRRRMEAGRYRLEEVDEAMSEGNVSLIPMEEKRMREENNEGRGRNKVGAGGPVERRATRMRDEEGGEWGEVKEREEEEDKIPTRSRRGKGRGNVWEEEKEARKARVVVLALVVLEDLVGPELGGTDHLLSKGSRGRLNGDPTEDLNGYREGG